MQDSKSKGLVYSTDTGRICPGCGYPVKQCRCNAQKSQDVGDGVVRVSRQTKGRKGSGVCLITGLPLGGEELKKLSRELKQKCGSGGTVKDGVIEIQGNHRDALVDTLMKMGFKVKPAGG
jgi:translation initiation factor 1